MYLMGFSTCSSAIIVVAIVYDLGQRWWLVKELHLIYFPVQNPADMRTFVTDKYVPYKVSLKKITTRKDCFKPRHTHAIKAAAQVRLYCISLGTWRRGDLSNVCVYFCMAV